ncbi:head-tail connector protein [Lutibacter holmesii]|uniref:Head-tail connector protein n=1 Tax=Lutibacter holmesii TaxID=1137985 RepID=A0ABW3WKI3_9FLAO
MATYINSLIHQFEPLITLAEAKQQLKLEASWTSEDDLLQQYIDAAIITAENYTQISINEAKFEIKTTEFTNNLKIKLSPITAIDSIVYVDENGDDQTLDAVEYELRNFDNYQQEVFYKNEADLPKLSKTEATPVTINITTGYAAPAEMPRPIKQACLLMITSFYEKREDSVENLPKASTNLLRAYRYYY